MGINLQSKSNNIEMYVSNNGWCDILRLGVEYGWKPDGTKVMVMDIDVDYSDWEKEKVRIEQRWEGQYTGPRLFETIPVITENDAKHLAKALGKAIEDLNANKGIAKPGYRALLEEVVTVLKDGEVLLW